MEIGLYLRHQNQWKEQLPLPDRKIDWLVCGDYGCPKATPSLEQLLDLKQEIAAQNLKLYYISPKVTEAVIQEEAAKIMGLLEHGISAGINDWGILHEIKSKLKPGHQLYLGRLLTSSLASLAWADVCLKKEDPAVREYLLQSNFHDQYKIAFLKEYGICGIEVDAYHCSENSYQRITAQGVKIIGYVDTTLLSVSRACPLARLREVDVLNTDCRELCANRVQVEPVNELQAQVYPRIEMIGNVLYQPRTPEIQFQGYEKVIYYSSDNLRQNET